MIYSFGEHELDTDPHKLRQRGGTVRAAAVLGDVSGGPRRNATTPAVDRDDPA